MPACLTLLPDQFLRSMIPQVILYLRCQFAASCGYVFLVAPSYWRRINWVGSLKDGLAEMPELWQYTLSTTIWWFEFGTTLFGVYCAAEASACSSGLRYASETLGGYMLGCGCWLNCAFFVVVPTFLHLYSGQPGSDLIPPGATIEEPAIALPPPPPRRKKAPPKRECPRCRATDEIAPNLKLCPICGTFVPPIPEAAEGEATGGGGKSAKKAKMNKLAAKKQAQREKNNAPT